jgi:hypothetical protein
MSIPQVIVIVVLILGVLIVPANNDAYWRLRYRLDVRLIRTAIIVGVLWWGGFWG